MVSEEEHALQLRTARRTSRLLPPPPPPEPEPEPALPSLGVAQPRIVPEQVHALQLQVQQLQRQIRTMLDSPGV